MKVGELYSVMAIIFASNFKAPLKEKDFKDMTPNWLVKTENPQNALGLKHWKNALENENENIITVDYVAIQHCFEAEYFHILSETQVEDWFKKTRYEKPFKEFKNSHICNMLAFLAAVLKTDNDEKTHFMLGKYLCEYFMPFANQLSKHLQITAKSEYYKAMGYFFEDFCISLKNTLGLKY